MSTLNHMSVLIFASCDVGGGFGSFGACLRFPCVGETGSINPICVGTIVNELLCGDSTCDQFGPV